MISFWSTDIFQQKANIQGFVVLELHQLAGYLQCCALTRTIWKETFLGKERFEMLHIQKEARSEKVL